MDTVELKPDADNILSVSIMLYALSQLSYGEPVAKLSIYAFKKIFADITF